MTDNGRSSVHRNKDTEGHYELTCVKICIEAQNDINKNINKFKNDVGVKTCQYNI